ncbi:transposase family protein [Methylocystis rosea]|uniref:transposase family protein n=1 Tax=Methylocystis rosea TaxID=173366 RepID=UPI0003757AE8|nr:transposase family protein [Methylocystis rosea]
MTTIDCILSCRHPDRRRAEGKIYGQVGVILFSIIAMLSGARSYRQIHALIRAKLCVLNAAFPDAALRRAPAYTSARGILRQLDPSPSTIGSFSRMK